MGLELGATNSVGRSESIKKWTNALALVLMMGPSLQLHIQCFLSI